MIAAQCVPGSTGSSGTAVRAQLPWCVRIVPHCCEVWFLCSKHSVGHSSI